MMNTDEGDLVRRLQSGDPNAIEVLYKMYFDRLYAFIFHSVRRDHSAAEDIIQNVFTSALKSARSFKGQSKPYTWLVGIAHHKINDYYRREKPRLYHKNAQFNDDADEQESIVDNSQSIPDDLESAELRLEVEKALSDLPLDYRQVLLFKYVEEMSVLEISQVMNRSPKAIDGLLTRSRKLLRQALSKDT